MYVVRFEHGSSTSSGLVRLFAWSIRHADRNNHIIPGQVNTGRVIWCKIRQARFASEPFPSEQK